MFEEYTKWFQSEDYLIVTKNSKSYQTALKTSFEDMVTFVISTDCFVPTEEILKVSSRYLDWFRFYEFFFVKNPTNCPIIGLVPYYD